jgi:peptide/nickel transport system permease protein
MKEVTTPTGVKPDKASLEAEEIKYYTATQFHLMWWQFRKHRLAILGSSILGLYLIVVLFAEFLAPIGPSLRNPDYVLGAPQRLHFCDAEGNFHLRPFVYGMTSARNPVTLRMEHQVDTSQKWPIQFFVKGEPYNLWGLIPSDVHLFGVETGFIHLLGTDDLGRDLLSRIMFGTRTSLSIGVIGVMVSFVLGLLIGGMSGYFAGWADNLVQRVIEFIRTIPTLPLWMALAAALPKEWSPLRIYFAITLILAFLGWTNLARRVRGKLLSMRDEDFVIAARIAGSGDARIIARHMLPSFLSYIIVDLSVSFPYMILGETALSFIGLGLRPPVISWGVLLQAAQNIRSIAMYPWLFTPAAFVALAVLAFNFVGDGLRDAADPYSR